MSKNNVDDYGFTMPPVASFGYGRDSNETEYDGHGFEDEHKPKDSSRQEPDGGTTVPDTLDGATEVFDNDVKDSEGKPVQVVVGWLVNIQGKNQGMDYRLHNGHNTVGRGSEMDVPLQDERISRTAAIVIHYDAMGKTFYASNGGGKCLAYVNRKLLMGNHELKPYDRIQLGVDKRGSVEIISELLFVPLCGEHFSWAEITDQNNNEDK